MERNLYFVYFWGYEFMARNFFKELKRCEEFICRDNAKYNDLQGNAKEYSLETKRAVYEIINLVEDCEFTSSKHTKFICENWMLDYKTLTAMWNRDNPNKIKAENSNIPVTLITDCGLTEFHGVATNTCVGIGPWWSDEIDEFTKDLKLL